MIQKLKNNKEYIIIFIIILLMTLLFSVPRYATDTYYVESVGYINNAINPYFYNGRLFETLFLYILGIFKIPYSISKIISWIIGVISLTLSCIIVYKKVLNTKKNKLLLILLSISTIYTPYVIEYFFFPEYSGVMCLEILFTVLSFKYITDYFIDLRKINIIKSLLFGILSILCYQGYIGVLFILPLIFLVTGKETDFKSNIKNIVLIGLLFVITAITTVILTKILGTNRAASNIDFIEKINTIFKINNSILINTNKFLNKNLFIILSSITFIITFIYNCITKKIVYNILLVLVIISTLIVPLMPHLFTNVTWITPRSVAGSGLLFSSSILIYVLYGKNNKFINFIYIILILTILISQISCTIKMIDSQNKNTEITKDEIKEVNKLINSYEKKNKTKVTKIKAYNDQVVNYINKDILASGDINVRPLAYDWSYMYVLSVYNNKEYKEGSENKSIENYCNNNNWDQFNKKQIKFDKDTLYVCMY